MTPEEVSVCVDELMASPKLRAKIQKTYEQVDRAYRESLRTGLTVQLEPIFAGAPFPADPVGEYLKTSEALRQAAFGPQPRKVPDNLVAAAVDGALSDGAAPGEVSRDLQRLGAAPPDPDAPFVGPVSFEEFYAVREAYQKPFKELDKAASDAFFGPPLPWATFEYAKPIDQERWDRDRETIREHLESQPPEGEPKMIVGKSVMDELNAYLNAVEPPAGAADGMAKVRIRRRDDGQFEVDWQGASSEGVLVNLLGRIDGTDEFSRFLADGEWHTIGVRRSGDNEVVYIDGGILAKVSPADLSDLMRQTMGIAEEIMLHAHPEIISNGQSPLADEPPPTPDRPETWRDRPPLL